MYFAHHLCSIYNVFVSFHLSWLESCIYLCRRWSSTRWTVSQSLAIWYTTSLNSMWVECIVFPLTYFFWKFAQSRYDTEYTNSKYRKWCAVNPENASVWNWNLFIQNPEKSNSCLTSPRLHKGRQQSDMFVLALRYLYRDNSACQSACWKKRKTKSQRSLLLHPVPYGVLLTLSRFLWLNWIWPHTKYWETTFLYF